MDAYLNAAMILGGMGPVAELHTTACKLFAGSYALFAGIVFLVGVGVVFAPVVHSTSTKGIAPERRWAGRQLSGEIDSSSVVRVPGWAR